MSIRWICIKAIIIQFGGIQQSCPPSPPRRRKERWVGQGPFYRIARIDRQPGRGALPVSTSEESPRVRESWPLSLPKQFALISRAVVDASGKFRTFKQAVYMKALTAKKVKGGLDLLASEIHSGRVLFRMEKHLDDTHGCTGRAGERLVERYDDRAVVFTEMNPIRLIKSAAVKALSRTFVQCGWVATACLRKTGFDKNAAYLVPGRGFLR
jgi:hypothetical protein